MTIRFLPCLIFALAMGSPALAMANVVDCSLPQARIDITRLDGGRFYLYPQQDLSRFYPDRAWRTGVSGMAIVVCNRNGETLDCAAQETSPADMGFDTRSARLVAVFARTVIGEKAVFRVDYTSLSQGTCYAPFTYAPDWRLQQMRPR